MGLARAQCIEVHRSLTSLFLTVKMQTYMAQMHHIYQIAKQSDASQHVQVVKPPPTKKYSKKTSNSNVKHCKNISMIVLP